MYFIAQNTKKARTASITKKDQPGSVPSALLTRLTEGFLEFMAFKSAFFDFLEAFDFFWLGGMTLFPLPTAYPQEWQPFENLVGFPVVPHTGQRTEEKNFPQCLQTLAF